jgi:hypothetical protein
VLRVMIHLILTRADFLPIFFPVLAASSRLLTIVVHVGSARWGRTLPDNVIDRFRPRLLRSKQSDSFGSDGLD